MIWDQPQVRSLLESLGTFGRGICLDRRGWGSSDALTIEATPSLDMWLDDIVAVMAATDSERAALVGMSEGGTSAMLFAATYPQRVSECPAPSRTRTCAPRVSAPCRLAASSPKGSSVARSTRPGAAVDAWSRPSRRRYLERPSGRGRGCRQPLSRLHPTSWRLHRRAEPLMTRGSQLVRPRMRRTNPSRTLLLLQGSARSWRNRAIRSRASSVRVIVNLVSAPAACPAQAPDLAISQVGHLCLLFHFRLGAGVWVQREIAA
jgi:pimeloyl-ACP methyl ester carboxylesterase